MNIFITNRFGFKMFLTKILTNFTWAFSELSKKLSKVFSSQKTFMTFSKSKHLKEVFKQNNVCLCIMISVDQYLSLEILFTLKRGNES